MRRKRLFEQRKVKKHWQAVGLVLNRTSEIPVVEKWDGWWQSSQNLVERGTPNGKAREQDEEEEVGL